MKFIAPPRTNHKQFDESEGAAGFRQALRSIHAAGGTQIEAGELQDIRQVMRGRGHVLFRQRRRRDPQELESVAMTFRRMLSLHEFRTFDEFDLDTSYAIDGLVVAIEGGADSRGRTS